MAVKLPRLERAIIIVDGQGRPTTAFHSWWQAIVKALESALTGLEASIVAIEAALDAADIALAAADSAQTAADALNSSQELLNSSLNPAVVLSADSTGSITISAHTRTYGGSGGSVSVNGGAISGFSAGDYVNVYYSDPTRVGGTVTFQGTTGTIAQEGAIHTIGGIQIPTTGTQDGYGYYPPGYIPPYFSY